MFGWLKRKRPSDDAYAVLRNNAFSVKREDIGINQPPADYPVWEAVMEIIVVGNSFRRFRLREYDPCHLSFCDHQSWPVNRRRKECEPRGLKRSELKVDDKYLMWSVVD
jgi:hypothetical protein